MNPLFAEPPRLPRWSGFVVALAAALIVAPGAWAVGGDGIYYSRDSGDENTYYSNQTTFRIPFDPVDSRTREVTLFVSIDFGRTYQKVTAAGPGDKEFRFEARRDGWYWFTVQTRDADGRFYPPDLNLAQPALKVCVDTHPPVVSYLRWLQPRDGSVGVEWDVADPNLDPATLRIDYRTVGGDWMPLPVKQTASGQYSWNPQTNAQIEARIQVQDKAHNPAEAKTPPANGTFRTGAAVGVGPGPASVPSTSPTPAPDAPAGGIMVNTRRIQLDFKIDDVGSSKVKAVEIWVTQDGRNWTKSPQDAGPEPPYIVQLPAEGRFGLTLIARSGVGLGLPAPKTGDQPQVWVEVDETKPRVENLIVDVGRGPDAGYVTVRWTATDKHMAANPVTISYLDATAGPNGPWQVMAANIPNEGRFVWRMPENLPPQILVRVEAIDQAGNIGSLDTPKPISTDLSIPRARVIDVHPAKADEALPPP